MSHYREPIGHTCPAIDKYIKEISNAIVNERHLEKLSLDDLLYHASAMANQLQECIEYLEEMRRANAILRSWGDAEAFKVDELEVSLSILEDEIVKLKLHGT